MGHLYVPIGNQLKMLKKNKYRAVACGYQVNCSLYSFMCNLC